jgi:hypothetical protein
LVHVGSKEAGPRVAAIISIVETCRRLSLPVRDYLGSVLPGLADFPIIESAYGAFCMMLTSIDSVTATPTVSPVSSLMSRAGIFGKENLKKKLNLASRAFEIGGPSSNRREIYDRSKRKFRSEWPAHVRSGNDFSSDLVPNAFLLR